MALVTASNASSEAASFDQVLTLAERGDPESMHAACYRYLYGEGGAPKSLAKASLWCERSAALGTPPSVTLLAEMYLNGEGVPKNASRARELYEQAARFGHPHAQYMTAVMLWNGMGGPRDIEAAKYFLELSVAQRYQKAIELRKYIKQLEARKGADR